MKKKVKTKVTKKPIPVKSTMLTLRIAPDMLELIELTIVAMNAERSMGSKYPTRSEAVELLMRWGWKAYEAQNKDSIDSIIKSRMKKSA